MPLVVEFRPGEHRCEGEEEQHAIQQNEPADRSIAVLEKHHSRNQPDCWSLEVQLSRRKVGQWDAESAKGRVEESHVRIVQLFGVCLAGLEFEGAIVPSQVA